MSIDTADRLGLPGRDLGRASAAKALSHTTHLKTDRCRPRGIYEEIEAANDGTYSPTGRVAPLTARKSRGMRGIGLGTSGVEADRIVPRYGNTTVSPHSLG